MRVEDVEDVSLSDRMIHRKNADRYGSSFVEISCYLNRNIHATRFHSQSGFSKSQILSNHTRQQFEDTDIRRDQM